MAVKRVLKLLGLVGGLLLSGCVAEQTPAPVRIVQGPPLAGDESSGAPIRPERGSAYYQVKPGDTLYAIAMVHNLEVAELAAWNRIQDPEHLFVGERLKVTPPQGERAVALAPPSPVGGTVVVQDITLQDKGVLPATRPQERAASSVSVARVDPKPKAEPNAKVEPKADPKAKAQVEAVAKAEPQVQEEAEKPRLPSKGEEPSITRVDRKRLAEVKMSPPPRRWFWPVKGRLVSRFGDDSGKRNAGIDIAARAGSPVIASADGVVAYADDGVPGYGNLVILRHGGSYMTAYAHNDEILVQRGQEVRAGQRIAKVGQTGRVSDPKLHFEMRKGVKPVNPLNLLPRQN